MGNWILDALQEPFKKKGKDKKKTTETKEEKLKELEEVEKLLQEKKQELMKEDNKEIPLPPKFEENKIQEQVQNQELTVRERLMILESNINMVIKDIDERLKTIESYLFRNTK